MAAKSPARRKAVGTGKNSPAQVAEIKKVMNYMTDASGPAEKYAKTEAAKPSPYIHKGHHMAPVKAHNVTGSEAERPSLHADFNVKHPRVKKGRRGGGEFSKKV
jgi:hypothetical protein